MSRNPWYDRGKQMARCHPDKANHKGGLCNDCYQKDKFKRNPGARHHMTAEQYWDMLTTQEDRCALCGKKPDRFVIDHDHSCCPGKYSCGECVRGLLCVHCNVLLAMANDSKEIFIKAVDYLD